MLTDLGTSAGVEWTVRTASSPPDAWSELQQPQPATVPGEVYADLLAAGAILDPFDGANEAALAWIGRTDWVYEGAFDWTPNTQTPNAQTRHDLVATGLDTVSTLTLNGAEIGRTANQHRTYRFDVTALLQPGPNVLSIAFEGPATAAERLSAELGDRPRVLAHPFNAIRKMAAGFGWDWGIDAAGVGIWRSIGIESWSGVRLAAVRPLALLDGDAGVLQTHVDLAWTDSRTDPVELRVTIDGRTETATVEPGAPSATISVRVPDVERWWPRGYGEPHRYPVTVRVADAEWNGRVGFRTAELRTADDAHGTEFTLLVNDEPVYVRGANWIPGDALLTRMTAARYRASILDATDAGMGLLRVWGGGIYEAEEFYEVCDELGVLVWQDFLFACAAYAEEEPLAGEVVAEAREAVTRLSSRPSLVLWNGNNENIWGYVEWGWREALAGRTWGDGYYTAILPAIVAELDPRTPFSPGSPYSFAKYSHPNDPRSGSMHIWDVWNERDHRHYRDYNARFVSEFGFQGPPAWSTLSSVVHDEPLDPYGEQMLVHQKAADGNLKLERGLGDHLPRWRDIDEWHWLTSLNQARAVAYGIEHFRSHYPLNRGAIVWQLNDNWPVTSWAAVDYAGVRKPLWYALSRVFADRLLTFQPRDGELALVAHNDSAVEWVGELVITRRSTAQGSTTLAEQQVPLRVGPRSVVTITLDEAVRAPSQPGAELLAATVEGAAPAFGYFVEDTALELVPTDDALAVTIEPTRDGYAVRVEARALVKDLTLFPDRLDPSARVDSALVTLLAGEHHTFTVTTERDLDEGALTTRPVLWSVNEVVAP